MQEEKESYSSRDDLAATVNPHFLQHLLNSAAKREVKAAEDVVNTAGVKLLLRGAPVESSLSEKLLAAKLVKPFEDCIAVSDGISAQQRLDTCELLVEKHPALRRLDVDDPELSMAQLIAQLHLPPGLQSLLTIYADQREGRFQHACGVALVSLALARRVFPGKAMVHRQLALAGLLHDVGELYISPNFQKGGELSSDQWRQVASHPIYGYKLLSKMEGAGPLVADAVLSHHERLDGFGYPRGLADDQFKLPTQVLAVAEWLTGLMEVGMESLMRASVAARLIPGEFSPEVLEPVHAALRGSIELSEWLAAQQAEIAARVRPLVEALERFRGVQVWAEQRASGASPELRTILQRVNSRLQRLQTSFSNAGVDLASVDFMMTELEDGGDQRVQQELGALLGEFSWRIREMERACLLRASLMGPEDMGVVQELLQRVRGGAKPQAAAAPAA